MSNTQDKVLYKTRWTLTKYSSKYAKKRGIVSSVETIDDNILLNTGIATVLELMCGLGTPVPFDGANARLGVGNSSAVAVATQSALQGASTAFANVAATYPQRSGQTVTWRAEFGAGAANFAWRELCVDNGSVAGVTLNRRVSDQGVKAVGQVWTLDLQITFS